MFVYALIDPESMLIRYIGKTTSLERPWRHHKTSRTAAPTYKRNWIDGLIQRGLQYEVCILQSGFLDEAVMSRAEIWWISYGRCLGWPLTNGTNGGEGISGHRHSEETRQKIREKRKLQVFTEEHRAALSLARCGNQNAVGSPGPRGELAGNTHLTWSMVHEIRQRVARGERRKLVQEDFNISHATIGKIVRKETWKDE